ncbi:MAG TPA: hypothetical protein VJ900_01030 [Patescibacteria group bacterium]|nr:hypothetical protein [Patescibacteria group bacterium]
MANEKINQEIPLKPETEPEKKHPEKPSSIEQEGTPDQKKEKPQKKTNKGLNLPDSVFKKKKEDSQEKFKQDKTLKAIEDILSQDIKKYYDTMDQKQRSEFKKRGEEAALKIKKIIKEAKIAVNKVVNLIKNWLFFIPGVNKYFLEQETKIKTEKILDLAKRENSKK